MELKNIPADILFYHAHQRFQEPPFRWAPTTIDGIGSPMTFLGHATCTPTGLKVERKLVLIRIPRMLIEGKKMCIFVEEVHTKSLYRVSHMELRKGERITFNALLSPPRLDPKDNPLEPLCQDMMGGVSVAGVNVSTTTRHTLGTGRIALGPEEPVLCEYQTRLGFNNMTALRSSIMYKLDQSPYPNVVVVKGEASSVRVVVT